MFEKYLDELLHVLGLEERRSHLPSQLSGGQQQRVAIARALMISPDVVLADEPTGNLDVETGKVIVELLRNICAQGSAILMITHNLNLLTEYPGKVYRFADHHIEEKTTEFGNFSKQYLSPIRPASSLNP